MIRTSRLKKLAAILLSTIIAVETISVDAKASTVNEPVQNEQILNSEPTSETTQSSPDNQATIPNNTQTNTTEAGTGGTIAGQDAAGTHADSSNTGNTSKTEPTDSLNPDEGQSQEGQSQEGQPQEEKTDEEKSDEEKTDEEKEAEEKAKEEEEKNKKAKEEEEKSKELLEEGDETGKNVFEVTDGKIVSFTPGEKFTTEGDELCGVIEIPEGVTSVETGIFDDYKDQIKSVRISSTVIEIGDNTFKGFPLTEVSFAEDSRLGTIGNSAFEGCTALESIDIPEAVTIIGEKAFYGCTGLVDVNVFKENAITNLTKLGAKAFAGCNHITAVVLPASLKRIGDRAFELTGVTSVRVMGTSYNQDQIGGYIFHACNINSVTFSEGIKVIPAIFYHATFAANTEVTFPATVEKIDYKAFNCVNNLTAIHFAGDKITSIGDLAFEETSIATLELPGSVTSIGNYAFRNCDALTTVNFPSNISTIGIQAFINCDGITTLKIPASVKNIGEEAFGYNTGLTEVEIAAPTVGNKMFIGCSNLTDVVMATSVTKIGEYAFFGCNSLVEMTVPDSVTSVGQYAIASCAKLNTLVMSANVTSLPYRSIGKNPALSSLYLGDKIKTLFNGMEYALEETKESVRIYISSSTSDTYKALQEAIQKNYLSAANIVLSNKLTYYLDGGSPVGVYPTTFQDGVVGNTIDLMNPVKEYYEFKGWYLDAQLSMAIGTPNAAGTMYKIPVGELSGEVNLYARWEGPYYYSPVDVVSTPKIFVTNEQNMSQDITGQSAFEMNENDKIYLETDVVGADIAYTITEGGTTSVETKYDTDYISLKGQDDVTARTYIIRAKTKYHDKVSEDAVATVFVYGNEKVPALYTDDKEGTIWLTYKGEEFDSSKVSLVYTGSPRTFNDSDITVYYGKKVLTQKTDYTVKYGNNKYVGTYYEPKAPYIQITGRGNYAGTLKKTFSIVRADTPEKEAIKLTTGNTIITLGDEAKQFVYDGTAKVPTVKVEYKYRDADKKWATKEIPSSDYELIYSNNINAGSNKAQVKIVFKGVNYYGEFTKKYSIKKLNIAKAEAKDFVVTNNNVVTFNGKEYYGLNSIYAVNTAGNYNLREKTDYTYRISANLRKGEATMSIIGRGNFAGTKKITYKILPAQFTNGTVSVSNMTVPVANGRKGVYKPLSFVINYNGNALKAKDYVIRYYINGDLAKSNVVYPANTEVKMQILGRGEGKGNFMGQAEYTYRIAEGYDFAESEAMNVEVSDFAYTGRANSYKPTIKVTNAYTRKRLALNRDYTIESYTYLYDTMVQRKQGRNLVYEKVSASSAVEKYDMIPAGTKIKVTLKGKNTYSGTVEKVYKVGYNIAKASVKVAPQTYTGARVTPSKSDITLLYNKKAVPAGSYNITSYNAANTKIGTGYITVTGTGEYIGSKKISFKITKKTMAK